MSERKYTEEQIVKALECFSVGVGCKGCPFIDQGCFDCGNIPTEFSESVLALINRQKAEIEKLQEANADLNESLRIACEANKDLQAEVERLQKYNTDVAFKHYNNGIREFVERLKETPIELELPLLGFLTKSEIEDYFDHTLLRVRDAIDNIVAEMTEEQDE